MENMNLIRELAWNFSEKTNINFKELFSEAALAYCEAKEDYDETRKAKFTTFAWWCMKNHLINFCKKESRFQQQFETKDKFNPNIHPTTSMKPKVEEIIEEWPENCKKAARMVLETPEQFTGSTPNFNRSDGTPRSRVYSSLRNKGWTHQKIQITMKEMKTAVQSL